MNIPQPRNSNYCAIIARPTALIPLPNCSNVQHAVVCGSKVIVGMETTLDQLGVFFPTESALSHEFLSVNNLYRRAEDGNIDSEKKGYFEKHGRVRAVKFRGHVSDGFWIPLTALPNVTTEELSQFTEGLKFDYINDIEICRKYVPRSNRRTTLYAQPSKSKKINDLVVEGQFKFHFDTPNLRRSIDAISPIDIISITDKWHGTSVVIGNLLTHRAVRWWHRPLAWLGVPLTTQSYEIVWSSRKVMKGVGDLFKSDSNHFYEEDVWNHATNNVKHLIPKGFTIYAEIVGFTQSGQPIQPNYVYGCAPTLHRLMVYRITFTNPDGEVIELSWPQLVEWCTLNGLETVKELYYGSAYNLVNTYKSLTSIPQDEFGNRLLACLEELFVTNHDCWYNPGQPAEGIVVRVDRLRQCESYKLKNFRFLEQETKLLDQNVVDIETQEPLSE